MNSNPRVPGVGEKEPAVDKGDQVRVKLDNIVSSSGIRTVCIRHRTDGTDDDLWMTLDVQAADRDTIYIFVRDSLGKIQGNPSGF